MNIEQDLQRALARKPAPPDLADRVIARLDPGRTARAGRFRRHMQWLAAAAAVIVMAGGAARYYEHQQQAAEAERVKEEIRLALRITSEKFSVVQARLQAAAQER